MAAPSSLSTLHFSISTSLSNPKPSRSSSLLSPSLPLSYPSLSLSKPNTNKPLLFKHGVCSAAVRKLSEAELVTIPQDPNELYTSFPAEAGIYGVFDSNGDLQFVGVTRNIASAVSKHRKSVPTELCSSIKIGVLDTAAPNREALTSAWKSWIEEHISTNGKPPPGNLPGNYTFVGAPPDLRLTPGRHVTLTVPLEQLIDKLVKEHKVVAFIKGSRRAPQCGFSQKVVGILEGNGIDFVSVDVLDEEHNHGLREGLKSYSNWPTFPQVFAAGELVGGCDIITELHEKGEIKNLLKK
ncbi:hypothetical protein LUZ60_015358 [Juncus effusus]|nr:hypothetical protein LUZ60_015358 [Juncus effusus]